MEVITNPGLVGGGVEGWEGSGKSSSDLKEQQAGHKSLFCILTLKPRLYTVHSVRKYLIYYRGHQYIVVFQIFRNVKVNNLFHFAQR